MEELITQICIFHDVKREELTIEKDTVSLVTREDVGAWSFDGGAVVWTYTVNSVTVWTENYGYQTFVNLFDASQNYF